MQLVAPEYEATLRANVEAQRRLGVDTRVVAVGELRALAPALYTGDLTYAAYEPDSGYADPVATTHGFVRRAAELGAEIRTHSEVAAITADAGRVTGVELADGERIETRGFVASGLNPQQTFVELLDADTVPWSYYQKVLASRHSPGPGTRSAEG